MDVTERKITKIARELSAFTVQTMKADGVGTAEFDFIHLVRHNPGITLAEICDRRCGWTRARRRAEPQTWRRRAISFAVRIPEDGRSKLMYATEKAESLKNSKARIEAVFYEWLLSGASRRKNGARSAKRSTRCYRRSRRAEAGRAFRM